MLAVLSLASVARAEYLVPEGNSAVNQYTQGVPSAGGQKGFRTGESLNGASPNEKLGKDNTKKLKEQGPEGEKVAELAAETAPSEVTTETSSEPAEETQQAGQASEKPKKSSSKPESGDQPEAGKSHEQKQSGEGAPATGGEPQRPAGGGAASTSGSSGTSGVLAAATGAEDGHLGLLLPLLIVAVLIWGAVYAFRSRARSHAG